MSTAIKFDFSQAAGEEIESSLFGANMIFTKNILDNNSSPTLDNLNVSNIRYPGGSVTEFNFDYRNPDIAVNDNSLHYDNDQDTAPTPLLPGEFVPLTSFLDWVESTGKSATVVLPTRNLVDQSTQQGTLPRAINIEAIEDLKKFLLDLLSDVDSNGNAMQNADIAALEIGNEYWSLGSMTAAEYGAVVDAVIAVIEGVFEELGISSQEAPDVLVQMGSPWGVEFQSGGAYYGITADSPQYILDQYGLTDSDFLNDGSLKWLSKINLVNLDIIRGISEDSRNSVDGVVDHYYYHNTDNALSYTSGSINYIDRDYAIWSSNFGRELDLHITEWNVKTANLNQLGLKGAGVILEQVENLVRLGVDSAFVWPYQHNTRNDLAGSPGDDTSLTPLGAAFKLAAESLVGTRRLDSNISGGELEVNAYSASEKFVFFVSSRSDTQQSIEIDFGDLVSSYVSVSGVKIGVDLSTSDGRHWTPSGISQVEYFNESDVQAQLSQYSEDELGTAANVSFVLDPYEVMRLEFVLDAARQFSGASGNDTWSGGAGYDVAFGSSGDDTLLGFDGNDTLAGDDGRDHLAGGGGHDELNGGAGDDWITGDSGNDTIEGGAGADTLIGGSGIDTVNYYYSSGGVTIDLLTNAVSGGWAADDTISGFERAYGSNSGNDVLKGSNGANVLRGYGGNDIVYDRGGDDYVDLGDGNDAVIVGNGADTLIGGSGIDTVNYYYSSGGVTIDLLTNAVSGGWAADDTISGFERAYGSNSGNDVLKGSNGANVLRGYGGNDIVYDRGGDDYVDLGDGNDAVIVGNGADTLIGGSGIDTVNYYYSSGGVTIDLLTNAVSGGWAADDTISGFERAYGSNSGNDVLKGSNGANVLRGYGGNDRLDGRAGNDYLDGGSGGDTLTGGVGADHFVFHKTYGADLITDFAYGLDELVLDHSLWGGGLTEAQVISIYASVIGENLVLDFGGGDTITLQGIASPGLLVDDILIV
ncbi:Bifunctional hemolysin/adenylate cyclase [Defluviimonas aquaemixtae]|uniref:Bifunctional hemolysin/adenylate cyclase n=1 Tax=Albidovulum aquaemixtae TaxID=1542388 RepID=A0A2R8BLY1_9RHOB|nr:calcium-binding protein [Defluviimonas aquaemixtae]SPH24399.1 Bifunctional hemolysin/adenylate cyclase [Defluviimonas aquaemixtae]